MPRKWEVLCSTATLRPKYELQLIFISKTFIRENLTFSQRCGFTLIFNYSVLITIIILNIVVFNSINFVLQNAQICVKIVPFYNAGAVQWKTSRQMNLKGLNWMPKCCWSVSIYLYFQNRAQVWLNTQQAQATERHCSLHWPSLCLSLWRRSQQPSVSQHSSSGQPQKHQLRHNNDRSRHKIVTVFKWKQVTDVLKSTSSILRCATWGLIKFHLMSISIWKGCVVRGRFTKSKRFVCLWGLCLLNFHR